MPDWLTILLALGGSALITSIVTFIFNWIVNGAKARAKRNEELKETLNETNEIMKKGIQALLRHELYSVYNEWIVKGYCPNEIKNDFENMYQQYHALGKNGVMDSLRNEIQNLPSIAKKISEGKEKDIDEQDLLKYRDRRF